MFMNFKKSTTTFYFGLIVSLCIFDVQLALSSDTCHSSCLTCSGPAENQCLSCNEDSLITKTGYCLNQCETPLQIEVINQNRVECNSPCQLESFIYADQSCARFCDAPLQQSEFVGYKFCLARYSNNQYWDLESNSCQNCHSSCLTCSGPAEDQCLERCSGNQYWNSDSNSCQTCHSSCLTCSGSAENQCLSCNKGSYITETGYCLNQCEAFQIEVIKQNRVECNSPCHLESFIYADQSCARFCHAPLEKLQFLGYNFCLLIDHGEGGEGGEAVETEEIGENEEECIIFGEESSGDGDYPQVNLSDSDSDIIFEVDWTPNNDASILPANEQELYLN